MCTQIHLNEFHFSKILMGNPLSSKILNPEKVSSISIKSYQIKLIIVSLASIYSHIDCFPNKGFTDVQIYIFNSFDKEQIFPTISINKLCPLKFKKLSTVMTNRVSVL